MLETTGRFPVVDDLPYVDDLTDEEVAKSSLTVYFILPFDTHIARQVFHPLSCTPGPLHICFCHSFLSHACLFLNSYCLFFHSLV